VNAARDVDGTAKLENVRRTEEGFFLHWRNGSPSFAGVAASGSIYLQATLDQERRTSPAPLGPQCWETTWSE
jgi:hypothetical protein